MCRMCDGFSLEDTLALDAASIAEYGYTLIGVENPGPRVADHPPWAYTVGLLDTADHPELIITGVSSTTSAPILSRLAAAALRGEYFEVGDTIDMGRGVARVGAVDEIQYRRGTFNMWDQLQRNGTLDPPELEAVQIVLPPSFFGPDRRHVQPLLADPDALVGPRPWSSNRAERRRRRPRSA